MPELYLYGPIGKGFDPWTGEQATSAADVVAALEELDGRDFTLRVNSDGGEVFEAKAIMEALARYDGQIDAVVDAIAASAASYVVATADSVLMAPGSMMMIHSPWTMAVGNATDLRKTADLLSMIEDTMLLNAYRERGVNVSDAELAEMLSDETWMSAEQAVSMGFADGISREQAGDVAALIRHELFSRVPAEVLQMGRTEPPAKKLANKPKDLRKAVEKVRVAALSARMRHHREQRESRRDLTRRPCEGTRE